MNLEYKFSVVVLLNHISFLCMGYDVDIYHPDLQYVGSSYLELRCNKSAELCWEAILNLFNTNLQERNTSVIYTDVFKFSLDHIYYRVKKDSTIY